MQQRFDDNEGKRRLLNIRQMKFGDVMDYCSQFLKLKREAKIQKIEEVQHDLLHSIDTNESWVLALEAKDGTIFGKMKVTEVTDDTVKVSIEIPNESWRRRYGTESVDQFLKICRKKKYFAVVELEQDNVVMERYINMRALSSNKVIIA